MMNRKEIESKQMEPLTLTLEECAELLGVSRSTAYNKLPEIGGFPILKVGRRLLVPRKAFYQWLESSGC